MQRRSIMGEEEVRETEETEEGAGESQASEETTEEAVETEETTEQEEVGEAEPKLEDGYIVYPDGEKIPVDRFEKVYGKGKEFERNLTETEEKLNLLQTSPEEYYKKYPDEKPVSATQDKIGDMVIRGGEYDGMTLSAVYEVDQAAANQIQFDYMNSQTAEKAQAEASEKELLEKTDAELKSFRESRAKDFFDKDFSALSKTEVGQIDTLISSVIDWGAENKRGAGVIEDMYFLMHKNTLLSDAKDKGIQALISGTVKSVPSITGGGKADQGVETGYGRFLNMSDDQMATAIADMPDADYLKFKKEAPAELKRKHPGLPWN